MKSIFKYVIAFSLLSQAVQGQVYYHKGNGVVTIAPGSKLLPVTTATATSVTSNNPGSTPTEYSTPFSNQVNHIFQHLDRSPVTTGLLRDYGLMFAEIAAYQGTITADNYLTIEQWRGLYLSVYSMRFNSSSTMPHPVEVSEQVTNFGIAANGGGTPLDRMMYATTHDPVTHLVAMHYNYQQFKANAVSSNLVYVSNGKIYDTPGRPTTPYEQKEVFAISLPTQRLSGPYHKFILRSELFYSNTGKTISSLQADFGDGLGYRTISFNSQVSAYYTTNGEKVIKLKVTYTDGTIRQSHSKAEVVDIIYGSSEYTRILGNTDSWQIDPESGLHSGGKVSVAYASTDQKIRKPVILVEGYDPWHILHPDDEGKNIDFEMLIDNAPELVEDLNSLGFDVVFVDFADGTDYIQRNANLVKRVIQDINGKKNENGSVQKNVVIGFSMGGIVTRYALRTMEIQAIPHQTRLWCSFDSPHQGANVPVAGQAAILHLANTGIGFGFPGFYVHPDDLTFGKLEPRIGRYAQLADLPATKQLLIYSLRMPAGDAGDFVVDTYDHNLFYQEYRQLGYPAGDAGAGNAIRNIAIASGSSCGYGQGFASYSEIFKASGSFNLPGIAAGLLNFFSVMVPFTNKPQLALGSLWHKTSEVKVDLTAKSLPDQQILPIYSGRLYVDRKILGIINAEINLTNRSFSSLSSMLPLDNAAGGALKVDEWLNPEDFPVPISVSDFGFIPTYSALDIGRGLQPIVTSDLTREYSPTAPPLLPKHVPFHNFFTNPRINERHVGFTPVNSSWLGKEIYGLTASYDCDFLCEGAGNFGASITGPQSLCTSGGTFTLQNAPSGGAITWSVSPANYFTVSSGTGTSASLSALSNSNHSPATITFEIPSDCGPVPVSQIFQTGGPTYMSKVVDGVTYSDYSTVFLCPGNHSVSLTPQGDSNGTVTWTAPPGIDAQASGNTLHFTISGSTPTLTITAQGQNSCNTTSFSFFVAGATSGCSGSYAFMVYPNPASDELNVRYVEYDSTGMELVNYKDLDADYEVVFYNHRQAKLQEMQTKKRKSGFSVRHLPKGLYYMNIFYKEAIIQRQIIIEK